MSEFGAPAYGQAPAAPAPPYAHWGKRVGAHLVDSALFIPFVVIIGIGSAVGDTAGFLLVAAGYVAAIALWVWNVVLKQGSTGQTIGKGVLGIKLIAEQTGQPIGGGKSFLRQLAHVVDSLLCDIGYLWPLWDAKRQTFADKILKTVVIDVAS